LPPLLRIEDGSTTGTLESNGGIQATAKITLRLISLTLPGPSNTITLTLGTPTG
jgi:hypothetical protein